VRGQPLTTFLGEHAFSGISHKANQPIFATLGLVILLWDETRGSPTATFEWGCDSVNAVKFNPIDHDVLASLASDRSLAFHDVRASTPIRKVVMTMRGNVVAWNSMEAFNLSVASEDHNVYTFDMRRLDTALNVHQDHVAAVLDIDYSPTGEEFVTGSYDRTLRIFRRSEGRSRYDRRPRRPLSGQ
jgi:DDB1- and CUL4-associated factor 13